MLINIINFQNKMKASVLPLYLVLLIIKQASAEWGVWRPNRYCDYNQPLIDEISTTAPFNTDDCKEFCRQTTKENMQEFYWGDELCCDFEAWQDGSFNCYVYEGHRTNV